MADASPKAEAISGRIWCLGKHIRVGIWDILAVLVACSFESEMYMDRGPGLLSGLGV